MNPENSKESSAQAEIRSLLRERHLLATAPLGLERRIAAALDLETRGRRGDGWAIFRWPALGLAAAGVLAAIVARGPVSELEAIVDSYAATTAGSEPIDFATDDPARLVRLYSARWEGAAKPIVFDFASKGFALAGGAVREIRGYPVRVSVYREGGHWVVCHMIDRRAFEDSLPGDAVRFVTLSGVNLRVVKLEREICILATRMPMADFRSRFAA